MFLFSLLVYFALQHFNLLTFSLSLCCPKLHICLMSFTFLFPSFVLSSPLCFLFLSLLISPSESLPAAMFLLCAVKVPDAVTEMMMAEFHHQEACQRINSILKFYTLWRFRYQVWPRMEEGAQQIFKVQNSNCIHFLFICIYPQRNSFHVTVFTLSLQKIIQKS